MKSVSLSGMGCSVGVLGLGLVKDFFKVYKSLLVLVLSMEVIILNVYKGKVKFMILVNVLFRMGGVGVLLFNRKWDKKMVKYKFFYVVRIYNGVDDEFYNFVF